MDFILKINLSTSFSQHFNIFDKLNDFNDAQQGLYYYSPYPIKEIKKNPSLVLLLGDTGLIPTDEINPELNFEEKIKELKGFFYLIRINYKDLTIEIYSSLFNILPLYYFKHKDILYVTSNIYLLYQSFRQIYTFTLNKQFILEKILFNYPLFDQTLFKEVKLLPCNRFIKISSNSFEIKRHTNIVGYFEQGIKYNKRKSLQILPELFIEQVKEYFPDEPFVISFTGGLDGRTLVACALKNKRNFSTFSFGAKWFEDIRIPENNAKELKIPFIPIYLDNKQYIKNEFYHSGSEMIKQTMGMESFIYSHFLYSAKILSNKFNYQLNGMFGSELFRALHIRGALTPKELVDYFIYSGKNDNLWINSIRNSRKLDVLNLEIFEKELNNIIESLNEYKKEIQSIPTRNQKFYKYVFEETFRKVFGSHIYSQFKYQIIRSPYLDFEFIKELLKTPFAGVNNAFFTQNPFIRSKGQRIYAEIIKRTSGIILYQKMDKGYRPADLVNISGKFNVAYQYIIKRMKKNLSKESLDNLGILSGIANAPNICKSCDEFSHIFNLNWIKEKYDKILTCDDESERDTLVSSLSLCDLIDKIKQEIVL